MSLPALAVSAVVGFLLLVVTALYLSVLAGHLVRGLADVRLMEEPPQLFGWAFITLGALVIFIAARHLG